MNEFLTLLRSGQAGIVVTSVEPELWFFELENKLWDDPQLSASTGLWFWDPIDGLTTASANPKANRRRVRSLVEEPTEHGNGKSQPLPLIPTLSGVADLLVHRNSAMEIGDPTVDPLHDKQAILCIRNFDRWLTPGGSSIDPMVLALVLRIVHQGQACKTALVMQTAPGFELPLEMQEHVRILEHKLPDAEQRETLIKDLLDNVSGMSANISSPKALIDATAGLSAGKLQQCLAESIATCRAVNPQHVFELKAKHLSRASKLNVWSPFFQQQYRLWPNMALLSDHAFSRLGDCRDMMLLREVEVSNGTFDRQISFLTDTGRQTEWIHGMSKDEFEALFRPERDFFTLKSIVGLEGLKTFLRNGLREGVAERAKMRHVLMLGVPGTGKSFTMQCCSGEFGIPLSSMQASNLYSKWLGDTDKILSRMLQTVDEIGGILAIDEFQRFLPTGNSESGVENRLLGTLLAWFNDQRNTLVLSAANNISNLPDEITRSGRVDALMFVGFPGREAKDAAWQMYLKRHELKEQTLPPDEYWTPADIMSCCRLAELQQTSLIDAAKWITPSYVKNKEQMDSLLAWAEKAGCICAETGERFSVSKSLVTSNANRNKRRMSV